MNGPHTSISAVFAVHNPGRFLPPLLERLGRLAGLGVEVIVVDDGSTDGSTLMLKRRAAELDIRLVSRERNQGVAVARNAGLASATCEYVWFADDDDEWDDRILETLAASAKASNADIVICRAELRHARDKPGQIIDGMSRDFTVDGDEAWKMLLGGSFHGYLWNKLIRRRLLGDSPFLEISSQSDFTGVAAAVSRAERVSFVRDVLYIHLVREGSITRRRDPSLSNLASAFSSAASLHWSKFGRSASQDLDYFRAWFLLIPLLNTPTRVRASWGTRFRGWTLARQYASFGALREARRHSPVQFLQIAAGLLTGPLYLVVLDGLQRVMRLSRKIGTK